MNRPRGRMGKGDAHILLERVSMSEVLSSFYALVQPRCFAVQWRVKCDDRMGN